ncbi:MAG: GatB/YqeY domain-containing protein [Chloroflexi bacterium]|nr:GatB/YqeY domain-containing protein [Chloroflexota bacterium]
MTLQEQLANDLKNAMKSGDKTRLGVLRMAKAAIKNAEIAKRGPLDDAGVLEVLSKEAKQRRESIAEFRNAKREDSATKEEAELSVLLGYLPQQMSSDEITVLVRQVIDEVGAIGLKDKGKVMPKLMPQTKGKADGQLVNQVVTQLLEDI